MDAPHIESFCWRIEQQIGEGGFALALGDPGTGKSAALRISGRALGQLARCRRRCLKSAPSLSGRLLSRTGPPVWCAACLPITAGTVPKPCGKNGSHHIEASLYRPVLLIDEAQEMNSSVFPNCACLSSADLDSRSILTIILAGDQRLATRLEEPELLPIASRIRAACAWKPWPVPTAPGCLNHLLKTAGNPKLMTARSCRPSANMPPATCACS